MESQREMEQRQVARLKGLVEQAWGVIANVSNGDWSKQSAEWQANAHRWGVEAGYRNEHPGA